MSSFDLTKLIGFNFNGLNIDQVGIDTSTYDPGSATDYVPGSTTYTVLGNDAGDNSGFGSNDADGGQVAINTVVETITNASNGVSLSGEPLANPLALGQIEDTETINGNLNNPITFDVLGYSADGESILCGLTSNYQAATNPNDPYNGQYYAFSYHNIDGNATPSNFFATTQTFNATNTLLSNTVTVSKSLIGKAIPSNDLILTANGSAGVRVNSDGSFTVLATTTVDAVGAITKIVASGTAATGSQGQPTLTFSNAVTPLHFQVIGFTTQQVLLQAVTAAGAPAAGPSYAILSISDQPPATSAVNLTFTPVGTAPISGVAIPCFMRGTRIRTPSGSVPVEMLKPGDLVVTIAGVSEPVIWVGHSYVDTGRHTEPDRVRPICVAASAFADHVPENDVYLSPDHAVFVDDMLVPVKELVNHITVRQVDRRTVEYFHVELAQHDVILAEGLPVESYLDTGNRGLLLGSAQIASGFSSPDLNYMIWESLAYRPLTVSGQALSDVRAKLAARAADLMCENVA